MPCGGGEWVMVGARVPRACRRCEMKNGWVIKKLGEVCELIGGGTPSIHVSSYYGGDIPWATVRDMNCRIISATERTITLQGFENSASNIIPAGNLVISTHVGLGKVCFVKNDTAINQDLKGVLPLGEDLDRTFLYYWFLSIADFIIANGTGSTVKGVKLEFVKKLNIPIPPLAEQKRIVAKIDAAFEKIDKLKANAERNLANAKELFQSALAEAMRPKDGWVEKRLGEVCKTTSGGTPIKSHREYYEDGNIPWLRSGEVCCKDIIKSEMFITELGLRNSSAKIMPKNTVLIAMYGATAAQAGILRFESATNQAICGILPDKYFEPEFLYYYFRTIQRQLAARAQGGAQPNISQEKIKDTLVPILPLSEQREIVKHLDLLAEKIKILEQNYTKQIADCVEMRQAVLREAFEGRL